MARAIKRATGLYKNGSRWWMRVKSPSSGSVTPRSTGTKDLAAANNIAAMIEGMNNHRTQWEWLDQAEKGDLPLDLLYDHHSAGTLAALRKANEDAATTANDADLDPWVDRWAREHVANQSKVSPRHKAIYVRQVRAFIPKGERFPRSKLTEDYIKIRTGSLLHPQTGEPLSDTTRRQYADSLKRFCKYARRRVPLLADPFEDAEEWLPDANSARNIWWDHDTVLKVLSFMDGEAKDFMTLVFGTGMELGAALAMRGEHIGRNPGEKIVVAPGTKNAHRENRTIFVSEWAWPVIEDRAAGVARKASLWHDIDAAGRGVEVRKAFYEAQVAAGMLDAPPVNKTTGKKLWHAVSPHTIHDARHSFCVIKLLGLDGEPRQSIRWCSMQLGHADETMVTRIYAKANLQERLKMVELKEAREAGRQEATV